MYIAVSKRKQVQYIIINAHICYIYSTTIDKLKSAVNSM